MELKEELENYAKSKTESYKRYKLVESMAGKEDDFSNSLFDCNFSVSIETIKSAVKYYLESEESSLNTMYKTKFEHIIYNDGLEIKQKDFYGIRDMLSRYTTILFDSMLTIILPQQFILSVERTGASIFQRDLDFYKIAIMEMAQKILQDKDVNLFDLEYSTDREQLYPKPVRENIEFVRDLEQKSKKIAYLNKIKIYYIMQLLKIWGSLLVENIRQTMLVFCFSQKIQKNLWHRNSF